MDCYNKAIKYLKEKYKKEPTFMDKGEFENDTDILIYILITEWSLSYKSQKELCEIINLKFIPEYVTNTENVQETLRG